MQEDLRHWETLLVSSMLQRPGIVFYEPPDSEFEELGLKNLTSALAFSALTTPNGSPEKKLYENIVEIPHYE